METDAVRGSDNLPERAIIARPGGSVRGVQTPPASLQGNGFAPILEQCGVRTLQGELSSAKVVSLLKGKIFPLGTNHDPAVSKIGVTNPISEAGHV